MIHQLHIENFKCHRDTRFALRPITCLVGPNGAGKSSVLKLIGMIDEEFPSSFGERQPVRARLSGRDGSGAFDLELPDDRVAYSLNSLSLKLRAEAISRPSLPAELPPNLAETGAGLASVIAELILGDPERFDGLLASLRAVVPTVLGLRVRFTRVDQSTGGHQLLFDMKGASGLPAFEVSDGTLIVTALLTAVHLERAQLLLLDDLEQGLHPAAQRELVRVIRSLSEQKPELQIIFTTHSPYIVDELLPEEVVVLALDSQGHTVARSLADHPDAQQALRVLTTGEFLAAEGESWVIGNSVESG